MTSKKFDTLFGGPPREPESPLTQRDMDIAASIQKVTEEIMLRMARHVHETTGLDNLCLAGGVALNCVANERIDREGPFENVWIQPAAGDAGGALGVALFIWHQLLGNERTVEEPDGQAGSLLGAEYGGDEIAAFLDGAGATYERLDDDDALCREAAHAIAAGHVVGWFQGSMEFGPRALGSRSILGDARDPEMQATINRKVKFREGFRPFAPIVLREHASEYFEIRPDQESPYMLLVAPVAEGKRLPIPEKLADARGLDLGRLRRSVVPAVTHVDYSARVQTVDAERQPLLFEMMTRFHEKTGCPVMVNTSFNLGWDPIVCTPRDAYRTFMSSELDVLFLGRFVLRKDAQRASVRAGAGPDDWLTDKLRCPRCGSKLAREGESWRCTGSGHDFAVTGNVSQLFWPHDAVAEGEDVTEIVKAFYEETPFPNYDDHDSVRSLIEKSRQGLYARRLDETIPYNADVLEVGCGTGQLTNFLGVSCRRVIGTDMCLNSLGLGETFRREHGLSLPAGVRAGAVRRRGLQRSAPPHVRSVRGIRRDRAAREAGRPHRRGAVQPVRPPVHRSASPGVPGDGRPREVDRPDPSRERPRHGEGARLVRGSVPAPSRVQAHVRRGAGLVRADGVRVRARCSRHAARGRRTGGEELVRGAAEGHRARARSRPGDADRVARTARGRVLRDDRQEAEGIVMAVIEIKQRPSKRDLGWFGFILPVFFGIVGSVAYFRFEITGLAYALWGGGAVLTAAYSALPPLRIPVYLGWMYFFFPLGWTISHVVLGVLYYLVVTPMALVMRPFGYDPMKRRFEAAASTYWIERKQARDSSRYLRQY
jgi:hypothetical protein